MPFTCKIFTSTTVLVILLADTRELDTEMGEKKRHNATYLADRTVRLKLALELGFCCLVALHSTQNAPQGNALSSQS